MLTTIIAGLGPDDFSDGSGDLKVIEKQSEEVIKMEEKFRKLLNNLGLSKDEALKSYTDGLIEEGENDFSKAVYYELNENRIATNHILEFIEEFYEIDNFIEKVENMDFLSDDEKYILKKFLKKEIIGELKLFNKGKKIYNDPIVNIVLRMSQSNDDETFFKGFESFFVLFKAILEKYDDIGLIVES